MKLGIGLGVAHALHVDYNSQRQTFVQAVTAALGTAPVAGYLPHRDDVLTSTDPWSGRVWTADATMAGQISALGLGSQRTFNGTSNYLTTVDTPNLSFGNGTNDSAFTLVALLNITDTAGARTILSKFDTGQAEYLLSVSAADILQMRIYTTDAVLCLRASDAAITMGSWRLFAMAYTGVGGATAANGITLSQDASTIASTATNNASYTAMSDRTSAVESGSLIQHTSISFVGSKAMELIVPGDRSAQLTALKTAVNGHFGLAL